MAATKRVTPGREGYKILFSENTVIMNKKFAAAAAKYVLKYDGPIKVPSEYLDRDLYTEDKKELCTLLNIHDNKGRRVGWTTIKKKLNEAGYTLTERHPGSRRCTVISL